MNKYEFEKIMITYKHKSFQIMKKEPDLVKNWQAVRSKNLKFLSLDSDLEYKFLEIFSNVKIHTSLGCEV